MIRLMRTKCSAVGPEQVTMPAKVGSCETGQDGGQLPTAPKLDDSPVGDGSPRFSVGFIVGLQFFTASGIVLCIFIDLIAANLLSEIAVYVALCLTFTLLTGLLDVSLWTSDGGYSSGWKFVKGLHAGFFTAAIFASLIMRPSLETGCQSYSAVSHDWTGSYVIGTTVGMLAVGCVTFLALLGFRLRCGNTCIVVCELRLQSHYRAVGYIVGLLPSAVVAVLLLEFFVPWTNRYTAQLSFVLLLCAASLDFAMCCIAKSCFIRGKLPGFRSDDGHKFNKFWNMIHGLKNGLLTTAVFYQAATLAAVILAERQCGPYAPYYNGTNDLRIGLTVLSGVINVLLLVGQFIHCKCHI